MRQTRVRFLTVTGLFLLASFTSAISWTAKSEAAPQPVPKPKGVAPIEIVFWHAMGGSLGDTLNELVQRFNQSQSDVVVQATFKGSYEDTYNALLQAVQNGNPPQVVQNYDLATQTMFDRAPLVPVQKMMDQSGYDDSVFIPAVRAYYGNDDGMVGMAFNTSTPIVYYNADLLAAAGVTPPNKDWTFADLRAICQQLQATNSPAQCFGFGTVGWFYEQILANSGGLYFNGENGRRGRATAARFNEGIGVDVFAALTSLIQDGYAPDLGASWGEGDQRFVNQQIAMLMDSSSDLSRIQRDAPFTVGAAYIPHSDSSQRNGAVVGGAALWLIDSNDDAINQAAWRFMRFLAEPAQQSFWHMNTGYLPVRGDLGDLPEIQTFWQQNPNFRIPVEQLSEARTVKYDGSPNYAVLGGRAGPFPAVRQLIVNAYRRVLDDGLTPQAALDEAAIQANKLLRESSSQVAHAPVLFWHNHSGSRLPAIQSLIEEFNATNPYGIVVQGENAGSYGEIEAKVIAGLRGQGPLPNLVVAYPNAVAEFARYGQVHFLEEYLADPTTGITDTADFYPGIFDSYRLAEYGGRLAGLQHGRSVEVMYYNADLLTQAGRSVPATWDEFQATSNALSDGKRVGLVTNLDASRFANWLWSHGGELLSADAKQVLFAQQPGIDSLLLFQQMFEVGAARLPAGPFEESAAFANGNTIFTFGSSAGIPFYRSAMSAGVNQEWGVARVPAVPGEETVNSYGGGLAILRHNDEMDYDAWLFLRWLTEPAQTARWAALSGYFPVRISAQSHVSVTQKIATDPQYAQAIELLPLGKSEPGIRAYSAIRDLIVSAMTNALQNGANVTGTLQAAADSANQILITSGPVSTQISSIGGAAVYTASQGSRVTLAFPAGALPVTGTVTFAPVTDLPGSGLKVALLSSEPLQKPISVTVEYSDADVAGLDESKLTLLRYDWTRGGWSDNSVCGDVIRQPNENRLVAPLCHFSDYSLREELKKVYLPTLQR